MTGQVIIWSKAHLDYYDFEILKKKKKKKKEISWKKKIHQRNHFGKQHPLNVMVFQPEANELIVNVSDVIFYSNIDM